jgi:hypothetical protein
MPALPYSADYLQNKARITAVIDLPAQIRLNCKFRCGVPDAVKTLN